MTLWSNKLVNGSERRLSSFSSVVTVSQSDAGLSSILLLGKLVKIVSFGEISLSGANFLLGIPTGDLTEKYCTTFPEVLTSSGN